MLLTALIVSIDMHQLSVRWSTITGSSVGYGNTHRLGVNDRNGSGPPDFCSCTLKVPRSAVGSGSGRPELARPMSQLGGKPTFANVTKRWVAPLPHSRAANGNRIAERLTTKSSDAVAQFRFSTAAKPAVSSPIVTPTQAVDCRLTRVGAASLTCIPACRACSPSPARSSCRTSRHNAGVCLN
jgi:hypothetical protein